MLIAAWTHYLQEAVRADVAGRAVRRPDSHADRQGARVVKLVMERRPPHRFVRAALSMAVSASTLAMAQSPKPMTDAEAQAIYALLIPSTWERSGSKDVLLLQRETVKPYACRPTARPNDPEWNAAEKQYEEAKPQILPATLRLGVRYRFIGQAKIAADDARLKRKYPGYNVTPGTTKYVAVSVVGFDAARTRAVVYVRAHDSGTVYSMEKRDGRWVHAGRGACSWIY